MLIIEKIIRAFRNNNVVTPNILVVRCDMHVFVKVKIGNSIKKLYSIQEL